MYPISLALDGRTILVVGAGPVAARKVNGLLGSGASIHVVAPEAGPEIRALAEGGRVRWEARPFEPVDLDGVTLAFAATGDAGVNGSVVAAAHDRGVLVCDAGSAARGDFISPAVVRAGRLTFAVESGGASPSFARRIARELAERFDERYARAAESLAHARRYAQTTVPSDVRAAVLERLAGRDVDALASTNAVEIEHDVDDLARALQGRHDMEPLALVAASRKSALALVQTRSVMAEFAKAGIVSTILLLTTHGDEVTDRPLESLGTDGVFVKELERALRERRADYAVHSCKDLPSELPADMLLAAVGRRADARDAFCSERYATLEAMPAGAVVGTSSPRRRALLAAARPDLRYETIRGNVDTRLRKLREGEFDAIVLALAGLERLGTRATHTVPLDPRTFVPAVAQGALAVEVRAGDAAIANRLRAAFNDTATELAVVAERAFLRTLRGGCSLPVGAHATFEGDLLTLHGVIASSDGTRVIRGAESRDVRDVDAAEALGTALATRLLREGGSELLPARSAADGGPLRGTLLLLPRTQDRESRIAPALRGMGAEVIEAGDADDASLALGVRTPTALLFPSSGSVRAVGPYLNALLARGARPLVAAMGEASSAAAAEAGFAPDVVATEPTVAEFVQSVARTLLASLESNQR